METKKTNFTNLVLKNLIRSFGDDECCYKVIDKKYKYREKALDSKSFLKIKKKLEEHRRISLSKTEHSNGTRASTEKIDKILDVKELELTKEEKQIKYFFMKKFEALEIMNFEEFDLKE